MSRTTVIAIANQKGGVGKTTTAVSLSAALARMGNTVLLVDLDCQCNATSGLGIKRGDIRKSTYDFLMEKGHDWTGTAVESNEVGLLVIPSHPDLLGVDRKMEELSRHFYLSDAIQAVKSSDGKPPTDSSDSSVPAPNYIIIDCPPALEVLTINAMVASDSILVPVQAEYYALEGLTDLLRVFSAVKSRFNPNLVLEGILITMFDSRTRLSTEVESELRKHYGQIVFETVVPRSIRFGEAPSHGQTIFQYAPESRGAEAYLKLAKEIVSNDAKRFGTRPFLAAGREGSGSVGGSTSESRSSPEEHPVG